MALLLGGCVADAPEPNPIDPAIEMPAERRMTENEAPATVDVCGLAAALPADDICHYVCDPGAMAAQLVADGADTGNCYQLYCQLSETEHVIAGVCLVP